MYGVVTHMLGPVCSQLLCRSLTFFHLYADGLFLCYLTNSLVLFLSVFRFLFLFILHLLLIVSLSPFTNYWCISNGASPL